MKRDSDWRWMLLATLLASWSRPVFAQGLGFAPDFPWQVGPTGGPVGTVYALASHDDGSGPQLYVGGDFDEVGWYLYTHRIARWNGHAWSNVGGFYAQPQPWSPDSGVIGHFAVYDAGAGPQLYASGRFEQVYSESTGWIPGHSIARWDGARWWPLGSSNGGVGPMLVFDDGTGESLYVGGVGQLIDEPGSPVTMGRFDGHSWSSVGGSFSAPSPFTPTVGTLCVHDDGSGAALYAAGVFDQVEGQPAMGFARWDTTHWTPIPTPWLFTATGVVHALASFPDANGPCLFAARQNQLWRWQNSAWTLVTAIGSSTISVDSLAVYDDGNGPALFVSGRRMQIPGVMLPHAQLLARWNGVIWTGVGAPYDIGDWGDQQAAYALKSCDLGHGVDLYLGGQFYEVGGQSVLDLARYCGSYGLVSRVCGGDGSFSLSLQRERCRRLRLPELGAPRRRTLARQRHHFRQLNRLPCRRPVAEHYDSALPGQQL